MKFNLLIFYYPINRIGENAYLIGIILAAGVGHRTKKENPKPLYEISSGNTILDHQIRCLGKRIGVKNILIVVGYKKELITKKYPQLNYVFNKYYKTTNTARSLLLALKKINSDFICLPGDTYFDEKILDKLLKTKFSCCLVNKSKNSRNEFKYDVDEYGLIKKISKSIHDFKGKSLGILFIKKKDVSKLKKELKILNDEDYFSKALNNLIKKNELKLLPCYLGNFFCRDFDSYEDFLKLKKDVLARIHKKKPHFFAYTI